RTLPVVLGLAQLFCLGLPANSRAGSATWLANPASGSWNTATNWSPATIPSGPSDIATFSLSDTSAISLSASVQVDSVVFSAGASAFTITPTPGVTLTLSGAGVVNDSGLTQNFVLGSDRNFQAGQISLLNNAFADPGTVFSVNGGVRIGDEGGLLQFFGNSSAGESSIFVNGGGATGASGGRTYFNDNSTAGLATFVCGVGGSKTGGGLLIFSDHASASSGTFTAVGGAASNANGGYISFTGNASGGQGYYTIGGASDAAAFGGILQFIEFTTAAKANITLESGTVAGAPGALLTFSGALAFGAASAGEASISIYGGAGLGAEARFSGDASGGTAAILMAGNGRLDLSGENAPGLTIGSVGGSGGVVLLGGKTLTVGSDNLSVIFGGAMQDGGFSGGASGSLAKIGAGTLTLNGASTYTGGTTISAGAINVTNSSGSATGSGPVQVNGGTLGGNGTVAGAVTIGSGGFLAPALGAKKKTTHTIQSNLTFSAGATYNYTFQARGMKARTDLVVANGVTINGGANVDLKGQAQGTLEQGTALTLIKNTAATPIIGTFGNLPDGAIVNLNGNNLQADYEGGDGNDLTLTVVP
ncbi:MAG: autotransporter-associated beta strand repeat-containing protein, partial [Spartobacteria bacterium]